MREVHERHWSIFKGLAFPPAVRLTFQTLGVCRQIPILLPFRTPPLPSGGVGRASVGRSARLVLLRAGEGVAELAVPAVGLGFAPMAPRQGPPDPILDEPARPIRSLGAASRRSSTTTTRSSLYPWSAASGAAVPDGSSILIWLPLIKQGRFWEQSPGGQPGKILLRTANQQC